MADLSVDLLTIIQKQADDPLVPLVLIVFLLSSSFMIFSWNTHKNLLSWYLAPLCQSCSRVEWVITLWPADNPSWRVLFVTPDN